jgi:hypothetical protein
MVLVPQALAIGVQGKTTSKTLKTPKEVSAPAAFAMLMGAVMTPIGACATIVLESIKVKELDVKPPKDTR